MGEKDFSVKYGTCFAKLIGGKWFYIVMTITDNNNEEKVRLAKCSTKANLSEFDWFEDSKTAFAEIDAEDVKKFSQVNTINFKKTDLEMLDDIFSCIKQTLQDIE